MCYILTGTRAKTLRYLMANPLVFTYDGQGSDTNLMYCENIIIRADVLKMKSNSLNREYSFIEYLMENSIECLILIYRTNVIITLLLIH